MTSEEPPLDPAVPPADPTTQGADADPERVGRTILLDQLTGRARSRKELADKLASRNVPDDVARGLLDRFEDIGLVDDAAFARLWVDSRRTSKGLARRALAQELRHKGVDDDVAREALDEIGSDAEAETARALVRKRLRAMRGVETPVAKRRLAGMLARKGYGPSVAYAVVADELRKDRADDADADAPEFDA